VIEPVGHRQLVFVLPKHLRRPFYRDRKLLTGLCRAAVEATHTFYRTGRGRDDLRVGMVVVPQRFGDKVNPHIHLHALVTDGAFDSEGVFHPMPFDMQGDIEVLTRLFAKRVLDLMVRRKRLSVRLRDEMLVWKHSGFSADGSVKVAIGDHGRLKRLVRYLARPAVSAERVEYDRSSGTVTGLQLEEGAGRPPGGGPVRHADLPVAAGAAGAAARGAHGSVSRPLLGEEPGGEKTAGRGGTAGSAM
jgi:hypothetical protein